MLFIFIKHHYRGPDRMVVWFTTICAISAYHQQTLRVRAPFMARCTRYNIMWYSLSVTCDRSVVFSGYSGFIHQLNWQPWYNWITAKSGVKHHKPTNNQLLSNVRHSLNGIITTRQFSDIYKYIKIHNSRVSNQPNMKKIIMTWQIVLIKHHCEGWVYHTFIIVKYLVFVTEILLYIMETHHFAPQVEPRGIDMGQSLRWESCVERIMKCTPPHWDCKRYIAAADIKQQCLLTWLL